MAALTQRDKRTLRIGAVVIMAYLALFYGLRGWKHLEATRAEYQRMVRQAQTVAQEVQRHENKLLLIEKLKVAAQLEPAKLSKPLVVAQASGAIQQAAQAGGIKLGPIRETPGSASARELTAMQLEGTGPIPAVMSLLDRLEHLGFPLVVDSVHIDPDPKTPGGVKLTLRLVLLDFEQWLKAKEDKPRV